MRIYTNNKAALISLLTVLILSCGSSSIAIQSRIQDNNGQSIAVITDVHYFSEKLHDNGSLFNKLVNKGDGKNLFMQKELMSAFVSGLEKDKPAVLLITGDLTLNGEKLSHKELTKWLRQIENLGIDVYVIPGNHDINNPKARKFFKDKAKKVNPVSPEQFRSIYEDFGYSAALSYDSSTLSYLIEPIPGIQLLMLDTNLYQNNLSNGYSDPLGSLEESTRSWIREKADTAKKDNKKLLVAMHHSLIEHNIMVSRGFTILDNDSLIDLFIFLQIEAVLSGHIHIQDIIEELRENGKIYDIATSAFSVFPHNYGILDFSEKNWIYKTENIDVAGWAGENGITDINLLDFDQYSADFFNGFSHDMTSRSLAEAGYTPSEISEISRIAGILNLNFFAGTEEKNTSDLEGVDLESLFQDSESFLLKYLESIVSDSEPSDNYLVIDNRL
jgi:3',5'-cyclic AMP phosphodiesterase CpdA